MRARPRSRAVASPQVRRPEVGTSLLACRVHPRCKQGATVGWIPKGDDFRRSQLSEYAFSSRDKTYILTTPTSVVRISVLLPYQNIYSDD